MTMDASHWQKSCNRIAVPEVILKYEDCHGISRGRYHDVKVFQITASSKRSKPERARLYQLPTEVLCLVFSNLDLLSLSRLSRTNSMAKEIVSNLPSVSDLRKVSRIITPLRQFGLLSHHAIKDLAAVLHKYQCECCRSRLGAFLFLPTLERACTSCLMRCSRFRMLRSEIADLAFDLKLPIHQKPGHDSLLNPKRYAQNTCSHALFSDLEGVRDQTFIEGSLNHGSLYSTSRCKDKLISLGDAMRLSIAQHGSSQHDELMLELLSTEVLDPTPNIQSYFCQTRKRRRYNRGHSEDRGATKRNLILATRIRSFLTENNGNLPCEAEQILDGSITRFAELFKCDAFTGAPRVPIYLPHTRSFEELVWCWPCDIMKIGWLCDAPTYSGYCEELRNVVKNRGITLRSRVSKNEFTLHGLKDHTKCCPAIKGLGKSLDYLEKARQCFYEDIIEAEDAGW